MNSGHTDITYEEEFDLKTHWCNFMDETSRVENPLHCLSGGSNYYDIDDIQEDKDTPPLSIQQKTLHINIQSLSAKFDELKLLLATLQERGIKIDYVLICETFLHDENNHLFEIPGYNFIQRNRKHMRRGGVAMYVNESIQFKLREDIAIFVEGEFESIFIETSNTLHNTIVGEIYRVPNSNIALSLERFDTILSMLSSNQNVILGTDQNLNLLRSDTHAPTAELLNTMFAHSLVPTITKPTRITHTSATLIDNIYIKFDSNSKVSSGIILTDISDHLPIFSFLYCTKKKTKPCESLIFEHRPLTQNTINQITAAIEHIDWSYLNGFDTNDAFLKFTDRLNEITDLYAPIKRVKVPPKYIKRDPWMTCGLMTSSRTCTRLYRKCLNKSRTDLSFKLFIKYRNMYNAIKRKAKQLYYTQIFDKYKYDIRNTWKTINSVTGRTNDKTSVSQIFKINERTTTSASIISDHFCDYFSKIGPQYANDIPASTHNHEHYLSQNVTKNRNTFFMTPTDPEEILKILKATKSKKSTGHDNISTHFLKQIDKHIATPISILINKSIQSGTFPDTLKLAKVIPIYKAKAKDTFSNYRPISLLPSISKILEKVVHKRLYYFLDQQDIFYDNQYGFRKKHSTIDAVTKFITDIAQSFENKQSTLAVYLDLSKAFDTIDHTILHKKLEYYGVRGLALDWFMTYLGNRRQYVNYRGSNSAVRAVECGVPQGSVLGPLLFIIYTNDLPNCLSITKAILFADDTTVYLASNDDKYLYSTMNRELDKLTDWFRANKLSLNISKTNYMLFSHSTQEITNTEIKLANTIITRSKCVKFLGMHIDEKLKWDEHIKTMKKKISSAFYAINKVKYVLPRKHLNTLYYSLVYPYLTYGIILWGATYQVHLSKLIIMQKKIIRAIAGAKYNAHTSPIFKLSRLLKLEDIYKLHICKFVLSHIMKTLPSSLTHLFTLTQDIHSHETRHSFNYKITVPKIRTVIASQSILLKGPQIWNNLAQSLYVHHSNIISLSGFSTRFRREAFGSYGN
jgi:hypothetical protein